MNKSLIIEDIMCEGCIKRIINALSNVKNIKINNYSLKEKKINVYINNDKCIDEIINIVNDLGFKVKIY